MKKYLLIIFAAFLFLFEGNAQCTITGGQITLSQSTVCEGTLVNIISLSLPTNISSNVQYSWESVNGQQIYGQNQGFICSFAFQSILYSSGIRRKVVDLNNSCIAYSNTVYFNFSQMFPGISPGSILGDDTICNGITSSVINSNTLPSGGPNNGTDPGFYYTWQLSTNGGVNNSDWTDISGATSISYTPGVLTTDTEFRRVDWSSVCDYGVYSNVITKKVMDCGVFTSDITGPTSITPNQTATYSITPVDGMKYLWAVTSGTITGGQGTYTITVMWDGGAPANARATAADYSVSVTETDATPESKTTTQAITATTTGINKGFAASGISVFPNPIKNQFTIEMPTVNTSVNYTVYTTTGVQAQSGSFNAAASGNIIASQLPAGMYQLVLNYDGVFTSTRLAVIE